MVLLLLHDLLVEEVFIGKLLLFQLLLPIVPDLYDVSLARFLYHALHFVQEGAGYLLGALLLRRSPFGFEGVHSPGHDRALPSVHFKQSRRVIAYVALAQACQKGARHRRQLSLGTFEVT